MCAPECCVSHRNGCSCVYCSRLEQCLNDLKRAGSNQCPFDHGVSLGRFVTLPRAFLVIAFAMTSHAAHAGELGPTSGGTVSISITVRPQVEVGLSRDQQGNRTCVLAKGIEPSYRTMLVSGDGMPTVGGAGGGSAQLNLPACNGDPARPAAAASYASYRSAARPTAPMIVLIIPD